MSKSVLTLLFSVFIFSSCMSSPDGGGGGKLNPNHFRSKIMEYKDEVVLDVRTPGEYESGHIKDALNINWNGSNFEQEVLKLDKDKPVFVYCQAGGRSAAAANKLSQMGFTQVYDLEGGIMNWTRSGMPTSNENEKILKGMTMDEYHAELNTDKLVLVDFFATWCTPCREMEPYLTKMSDNQSDVVKIFKINTDKNNTVTTELNIKGLPTLLLYKNNKVVWSHEGYISEKDLLEKIINFN